MNETQEILKEMDEWYKRHPEADRFVQEYMDAAASSRMYVIGNTYTFKFSQQNETAEFMKGEAPGL